MAPYLLGTNCIFCICLQKFFSFSQSSLLMLYGKILTLSTKSMPLVLNLDLSNVQ